MILLELKRYIRQHERVSFSDICNRFDLSEDAAAGLLQPLVQQGHIQTIDNFSATTTSCNSGGCSGGCASQQTYYQWLERKVKQLSLPVQIKVSV
ncbi:transcriptional regulator [Thiomicrorhabdus sp. 6S2-11]|uniref:Transcriptional regulator n=1 Tax=Thiomicrorhabdus marina TaxID=2818442 RepID=A0ABS3Q3K5_9GAMM|nr:FeoC-like transcriptional regulator [Thiomicrorhabdus marina]MBO1926907.1 transcriptional regulator [Thiomicrorhabdus marina]